MADNRPVPEGKYFDTPGGNTIHYHETGPRNPDRPSVLFLHGSGPGASGYSNFKKNFAAFAEAGHHCLTIDYPGYGYASKPTDIDYSTDFYVGQIHAFLTGLGLTQVVPVGNSLGGLIATAFTLAHPAMVPRLILMAPGGLADAGTYIPYSVGLNRMFEWVARRPTDIASFRQLLTYLVAAPDQLGDDAVAERFPVALTQPSEVWGRMRTGNHADRLAEIACPILCFWGAQDRFIPVAHGLVLLERAKDVRLIVSNRCGHWYMIEQTEDFNRQSIAFLNGEM